MRNVQVEILKKVPLFRSLGKRELQQVSDAGRDMEFLAGATIVAEGSIGTDFYLIESGRARVTQGGALLRELQTGDFFGELGILYEAPRTASVVAKTRVWVFRLDREAFLGLLDQHGVIARKVLLEFAKRTRPVLPADVS